MAEEKENRDVSVEAEGSTGTTMPSAKAFLGFTGSYDHGIDAKGRLIIPSSFRSPLGEQFVTGLTLDMKAIAIYPIPEWQKQQAMLQELLKKDIRVQRLIDHICKYSYTDCEMDSQGRLLLPSKLRNKILGSVRDVEVSGAKTHIRVLPSDVGEDEDKSFEEEIPDTLAFIANIQQQ